MKVQELSFTLNLSEVKLKEVMNILLGLKLQGDLTSECYIYLSDELLYVLKDLVHPFLRGDVEEFNIEEDDDD